MGSAKKAVVIGGGYIGLECAASLATWGLNPHVVLMEPHTMVRGLLVRNTNTSVRQTQQPGWFVCRAPPLALLSLTLILQPIHLERYTVPHLYEVFPRVPLPLPCVDPFVVVDLRRRRGCGPPRSPPSTRRCTSPRARCSTAPPRWCGSWRRTGGRAAWRSRAARCSRRTSWWSASAGRLI
jgi:hypothetical protein